MILIAHQNIFIKNVSSPCEKLAVVVSLVARRQDPLVPYKNSHRRATNGYDIYTHKQISKIMNIARIARTLATLYSAALRGRARKGRALPPWRDIGQYTVATPCALRVPYRYRAV